MGRMEHGTSRSNTLKHDTIDAHLFLLVARLTNQSLLAHRRAAFATCSNDNIQAIVVTLTFIKCKAQDKCITTNYQTYLFTNHKQSLLARFSRGCILGTKTVSSLHLTKRNVVINLERVLYSRGKIRNHFRELHDSHNCIAFIKFSLQIMTFMSVNRITLLFTGASRLVIN